MTEARLWIAGAWCPSASGATFQARSPATGEALAQVAEGTRADADRAVRAANAAAPAVAALTPAERARLCHRIADAIAARREELARIVTLEQGKPYHAEALAEADEAAECFRLWGEEARRLLHVPYGGVRQSGVGRIGGKHSLWEMTDLKTIVLDLG